MNSGTEKDEKKREDGLCRGKLFLFLSNALKISSLSNSTHCEDLEDSITESVLYQVDAPFTRKVAEKASPDCYELAIKNSSLIDQLGTCTWESIDFNNITKETPWTGPKDTRHFRLLQSYFQPFCQSIYHKCTEKMIKDNCEPGIWESLEDNRAVLKKVDCVGIQIYDVPRWRGFVIEKLKELKKKKKKMNPSFFDLIFS